MSWGLIETQLHLEYFKNIDFKWSNEWILGITHMLLFTLQYHCLKLALPC